MLQGESADVQADTARFGLRSGVRKTSFSAPQHVAIDVSGGRVENM